MTSDGGVSKLLIPVLVSPCGDLTNWKRTRYAAMFLGRAGGAGAGAGAGPTDLVMMMDEQEGRPKQSACSPTRGV